MTRPRIVVAGSLNMDLVVSTDRMPRIGETITGRHIDYIPGGKGANQAVGCARLGADTSLIGVVGTDAFGAQIVQALEREGVGLPHVERTADAPTGTATIVRTPEDNCIIVVPGANAHCSPEQMDRARALLGQADALLVQLEIPAAAVAAAVEAAASQGVRVIVNPAPARRLPAELLRRIDVLTPNETELETLTGEPVEQLSSAGLARVLAAWEAEYGHRVIVTQGRHGCSFLDAGRLVNVPAPQAEAVDTTGAGDAFNAALALALCEGRAFADAAAFAVTAASLSVTRFGAQAGMPTRAEVEAAVGRNDFEHEQGEGRK
ncbi:ribokinase [Paenibacillus athensensis]|uniref:Ribokinase n=1 Tax=Paenibacillus athensensis TaxID=1967502 RepID=A0A4Y8PWX5_9BACL|nr:ribokinase [Paenibacillus athensensis]MCD1257876.1 ribokinase [Paenibacillus athensensis]